MISLNVGQFDRKVHYCLVVVIRLWLGGVQLIFKINGSKILQFQVLECGVGFLISIVIDRVDLIKVLFDERVYPNIRVSSFLFLFIIF